jgi:hypothetical protein
VAPWASTGWEGRWHSVARVLRGWSRRFGGTRASRGVETVVPTVRSYLRVQVFDDGLGGLTGKRGRGTAPVG